MRNITSNLNQHLFDHFVSQTTRCPNCGAVSENNYHFFFECPAFAVQRNVLLLSLQNFGVVTLDTLLRGDDRLSRESNVIINTAVLTYIKDTRRFA